jgi:hypothetical protein
VHVSKSGIIRLSHKKKNALAAEVFEWLLVSGDYKKFSRRPVAQGVAAKLKGPVNVEVWA